MATTWPPGESASSSWGEQRARSRGRIAIAVLLLAGALFVSVGALAQLCNVAFGIWFTEIFIFFAAAWVLIRVSGRDPVTYAGLGLPPLAPVLLGGLLGVVNYFALVIPLEATAVRLAPAWLRDLSPDTSQVFENQTGLELVLIVLGVGLVAPLCEELGFRGVVQQGLFRRDERRTRAWVAAAILFSAFHLDAIGFVARVELGLLFGWLYLRSGSLYPGVAAHAANNLTATALFFLSRGQPTDSAELPLRQAYVMGALGSALLALLLFYGHRAVLSRPPAPHDPDAPLRPARSLLRPAWPWALGALASALLLAAVDRRGVQLNFVDNRYPLPPSASGSSRVGAELERLQSLRKEVRRGQAPLQRYVALRRRLWRLDRQGPPPPGGRQR